MMHFEQIIYLIYVSTTFPFSNSFTQLLDITSLPERYLNPPDFKIKRPFPACHRPQRENTDTSHQTRLLFPNPGSFPPALRVAGGAHRGRPGGESPVSGPGVWRQDEAPLGRCRAAVGDRLLRLSAAAERRERAVEADAAGRAVPELHADGEKVETQRQVDARDTADGQAEETNWV